LIDPQHPADRPQSLPLVLNEVEITARQLVNIARQSRSLPVWGDLNIIQMSV
jgi:hypothetical protein